MNTQDSRSTSGPGPDAAPAATAPPGAEFFDRVRALGVVRPDEGRWAAGVCAGLARRWGLDPLLVRGLFVVAGLVTGIGLGVYGVLWLLLPHPDGRIHAQQVLRGTVTAGFVGGVSFVLIDFPLSNGVMGGGGWGFPPFGGIATLAVVGLGIWWLVTRGGGLNGGPGVPGVTFAGGPGTTPDGGVPAPGASEPGPAPRPEPGPETAYRFVPPAGGQGAFVPPTLAPAGHTSVPVAVKPPKPPRRPDVHKPLHPLTFATLGAALLAVAGVAVWDRGIHHLSQPATVAVGVALAVVALGIVLAGTLGRRSGGLAPIALLLALGLGGSVAWQGAGLDSRAADVTWTPTGAGATPSYALGLGRAVLDLTGSELATRATATSPVTLPASLGAGELVVIVPRSTSVRIDSSIGLGEVTDEVGRRTQRGGGGLKDSTTHGSGLPAIVVNAQVGVGRVWIVPQGTKVNR